MKFSRLAPWTPAFACAALLAAQTVIIDGPSEQEIRLPSGKLQKEEILRLEHERTVKDAEKLVELAQSLKEELEKNDRYVLSLTALRKTEEIQKLARQIRDRMRRF